MTLAQKKLGSKIRTIKESLRLRELNGGKVVKVALRAFPLSKEMSHTKAEFSKPNNKRV